MPRITFPILLGLLLTLVPAPRLATPARAESATAIERQLAEQRKKIKRVETEIDDHRELIREARTKEINLLGQLEILDQALSEGRDRLANLHRQTAGKEEEIKAKNEELEAVTSAKAKTGEHVRKRLAAYYRLGDIGFMNVTFSTMNLPELLNFKEYFLALIAYDRRVIDDYRQVIETLTRVREELRVEKEELLAVIVEAKQQEEQLSEVRQQRLVLLSRVNTEKKLYQRALTEMEEAATRLTLTMTELQEKLAKTRRDQERAFSSPKKRRPGSNTGFTAMKGRLQPPARGAVTTYFGKNTQGRFGLTTNADGIDIKTLAGAEIIAIYGGKVVYAGQLRGYGNLLIIDHGQQYYSLLSRAAEFYKGEGDEVKTGEVIGVMSDQGGLLGDGLHFEIRRGTEPENPLSWVNRALLKIN
jgi:septal ring factor EnvC (AmiA/AmiB activator)